MILTSIIIEDEIPAQKILQNYISKIPNLELIETFNNATEANRFLNVNPTINIVFLDINLPDISGIDFIKTVKNPPAIIITTAYPDYALDSFELDTIIDYLVKPFSFDRFLKGFHKAKNTHKKIELNPTPQSDFLFLNVDKTLHKIAVNDILYIESDRNYITVFTKEKKLSYIDSLRNWKEKLSEKKFIQVHKSFIINSTFVEKISGNELFINDVKIPIGRTFKQHLLQQLKIV